MNAHPTTAPDPVPPVPPLDPVLERGVGDTGVVDDVRAWIARYIGTVTEGDLDTIALWIVSTYLTLETYTTPRLLIDSPVHGSGKTTTCEHIAALAHSPVSAASLSSPSLLAHILENGPRTIVIDEADRSLNPKRDGVGDLYAVINSGYKRGGCRPVLVPVKGGGWEPREMPTFGPVVIAGNSPDLPDDLRSRCIRVLLIPDLDGALEESDWEHIGDDAHALATRIAAWADDHRDEVAKLRPDLPPGIRGRDRERWGPLLRVAVVAGGHWPTTVARLALADLEQREASRDEGVVVERPHLRVLRDMAAVWPTGATFVPTETILARLVAHAPDQWGAASAYGKPLTAQRLGRMLSTNFRLMTSRPDTHGPRGYVLAQVRPILARLHIDAPGDAA